MRIRPSTQGTLGTIVIGATLLAGCSSGDTPATTTLAAPTTIETTTAPTTTTVATTTTTTTTTTTKATTTTTTTKPKPTTTTTTTKPKPTTTTTTTPPTTAPTTTTTSPLTTVPEPDEAQIRSVWENWTDAFGKALASGNRKPLMKLTPEAARDHVRSVLDEIGPDAEMTGIFGSQDINHFEGEPTASILGRILIDGGPPDAHTTLSFLLVDGEWEVLDVIINLGP